MGMQVAAEDWIAHHARFSPHRDAIHDLASGRRSIYRTLDERISRAACFFHNILGVRAGERIAVLCHNDSDVFEIQFAPNAVVWYRWRATKRWRAIDGENTSSSRLRVGSNTGER